MLRKLKNEIKRFKKKISRPIWLFSIKNKPWYRLFQETQREINSTNPNSWYDHYQSQEMWFWIKMLEWLYIDNKKYNFKKIIDVGSAIGTLSVFSKKLSGVEVYAIDLSKNINTTLIAKYNINHEACNIEKEPLPWQGKYDCIIFSEILEHLNTHPLKTLLKLRNNLEDNGILYVTTPDAEDYGRITEYFNTYQEMPEVNEQIDQTGTSHIYHFTKAEMLELFNRAGLKVERFAYSPGITYKHLNFALRKVNDET